MKQIIWSLLVFITVMSLVACQNNEEASQGSDVSVETIILDGDNAFESPFTISTDASGKHILFLSPMENGNVIMNIAENTTIDTFFTAVAAEEGYTLRLSDPDGAPITDTTTIITTDMIFGVYAEEADTPEYTASIRVVSAKEMDQFCNQ